MSRPYLTYRSRNVAGCREVIGGASGLYIGTKNQSFKERSGFLVLWYKIRHGDISAPSS